MRQLILLFTLFTALFSAHAKADIQQRITIFTQQSELFRQICFSPSGVFYKDRILFDVRSSISDTVMDCNAQALALEEERLAIEALIESGACEEQVVSDEGLISLLNGSGEVVSELACPGIGNSNDCMKDLSCNLLSSTIPVGAAAMRFAFKDHPTLSQCGSGNNCFSNIGKAIWDNLWDTVTGLYDLGKMGLSWMGDRLGSLWSSEDQTSTRGIAATEITDSELDQFLADPVNYVFNFGSRVIEMIANGISSRYGCAEWTGAPHISECIKPMSWECANCDEKLNMVCGVSSYIGATVITSFFTGGATAAVQITSKAAASATFAIARSVPGASRIAQTMARAGKLSRAGALVSSKIKNVWGAVAASRTVQGITSVANQLKAGGAAVNEMARKKVFLYADTSDGIINAVRAYNRLSVSAFRLGYTSTGKAATDAKTYLYTLYPKADDITSGRYIGVRTSQDYLREATKRMSPEDRAHMRIRETTDAAGERRAVVYDTRAGSLNSDISYRFTPEPPPQPVVTTTIQSITVTARRSDSARFQFVERWQGRKNTTPDQNQIYIREALRESTPGTVFLDTQNTALKHLNDTLKDKALVDALGNRYNELVDTALKDLKAKYPEISVLVYSDYKSMRAAVRGPPGKEEEYMRELGLLMDRANEKFLTELRATNMFGEEELTAGWFRAGLGRTADEANLVTRFSRGNGSQTTTNFTQRATQERIQSAWQEAERSRQEIVQRFSETPLLRSIPGTEKKIPTAEVLEVVRKNSDPAEIARILSSRYNTTVSTKDAQLLNQYFTEIDQFSPGLMIAQRVEHRFDDAVHGGFSIDFAGVGSFNAEASAMGLAQGKDLSDAVRGVRAREVMVTRDLDALKIRTQNAVYDVLEKNGIEARITISGDDMLVIPDKPLSDSVRREIAEAQVSAQRGTTTLPSGMRTSFFAEGIPEQATRSIQATVGESVEKALRKKLEGVLSQEDLRQTLFAVEMRGTSPGTGDVSMRVVNPNLSPEARKIIEQEFSRALETVNNDLSSSGKAGTLKVAPDFNLNEPLNRPVLMRNSSLPNEY